MNIITAIVLTTPLLVGCSELMESKLDTTLETTLSAYHTAMRWGDGATLVNYHRQGDKQASTEPLAGVRVLSYEVRRPPIFVSELRVMQVVEIQYVVNDTQRVRSILDHQEWHYQPDKNIWQLHSPWPSFSQ